MIITGIIIVNACNYRVALRGEYMKIAISTDNNQVAEHFGRCPSYTIVTIECNKVVKTETVNNPGHEPGQIPKFLHDKGVACIIAGGMGMRAQTFFQEYGIQAIVGVGGTVDDTVSQYVEGELISGSSLCSPGAGKGYGIDKTVCDHEDNDSQNEQKE